LKLSKATKDQYRFQLTAREKNLLLHVLGLYPRIPPGYQRLSRSSGAGQESNQQLLEEALSETRLKNQKELHSLLSDPRRLKQEDRGWRLTLSSGDLEWMLQILNDIRIGSWIRLGSPDYPLNALNTKTTPDLWAMEMAGAFQMGFLQLLDG
jgi:hypothetical protein